MRMIANFNTMVMVNCQSGEPELFPAIDTPYRAFPVRWVTVNDDTPGWEDAWDIIDLSDVNGDEEASDSFYYEFNRYKGTRVGRYPMEILHGVGIQDFVFQVGAEEKVNWMRADNGIGYFHKSPEGLWAFSCPFHEIVELVQAHQTPGASDPGI
ncbi:hypothetical protein [Mangrovibacter phragmitis]|uniref:hypothetical protein n=1 Tax=Mangrovibacter phragmitis TaxID=1691903 RepID=UPI00336A7D34